MGFRINYSYETGFRPKYFSTHPQTDLKRLYRNTEGLYVPSFLLVLLLLWIYTENSKHETQLIKLTNPKRKNET